jgi:type II secretory pathway component PulJ
MLVAVIVSTIVIAGTYAGYSFLARQQMQMSTQTSIDASALRAIDLIQSDIRMSGYKDYQSIYPMTPSQAIAVTSSSVTTTPASHDISMVFDDYDVGSTTPNRTFVRYYLQTYSPSGGQVRNRLIRDWRICSNPASGCTLASSVSKYTTSATGEPILDWVTNFSITSTSKSTGTYAGVPQTVQVNLTVKAPRKIEGTTTTVSKNFIFLTRSKNVSLVP